MTSVKLDWQEPMFSFQRKIFFFFLSSLKWAHDSYLPWWRMQHCFLGPPGSGPCSEKWAFCCREIIRIRRAAPGFSAPLLHNSVSFARPCPFPFQKTCWKPEVWRVQCHLFPLVRASGLTSPRFSFLSREMKIKNSPTHKSPSLARMFYFGLTTR